ncbi:helix-turn-helix domain-containing protein [Apilactobacillus xinyiensis]|uniref:helix-turn-helix domain-containing protein n=1 Tax=Apilactobacillus xinyiensis TaxID=2841032 RepID=UPI00200FE884|nr:helix-turn-helix domain-containing protein [Apilactobacillus xinyiensis]MCL0329869.1 helix-turn-helix domain-containing protein [Apilactobacillus xinyiensis]
MNLASKIKTKREKVGMSQSELAQKLHVTRQTVSRWENDQTIPNLDTLNDISDELDISLDELLKNDNLKTIGSISKDVKLKKRYKLWFIISSSFIGLFIVFLLLLSWGRYNNNDLLNRVNPFIPYHYGYAVLPEKIPTKNIKGTVTYTNGKKVKQNIAFPQPITAQVTHSPFGDSEWLTFSVGEIPKRGMNYAYVEYKGSYVRRARLISRDEIPRMIRDCINDKYIPYKKSFDTKKSNPFK